MSEENLQQSNAPVESQQTTANEPAPQEVTLEDIAKKYSIEEQTKTFTAKPEYQAPPIDYRVPDPVINPDEFTKYQLNQTAQVMNTMTSMQKTVEEMRRTQETERLNVEVTKAVARVNESLKVDPKFAEILLEKEYRDNQVFRRIWDNRYSNPKALDEALDVVAKSNAKMFQVSADPQLVENQRAAKVSQKAMSTTNNKSQNEELANMSDGDFERWWNSQRGYS